MQSVAKMKCTCVQSRLKVMVWDVRDMFAVGSNNILEGLWTTSHSLVVQTVTKLSTKKEAPETLMPQLEKFWNLDEAWTTVWFLNPS